MTMLGHYEVHSVADIFPMMSTVEITDLAADIADHGLREPIWLDRDGRIIDGRNRYLACVEVGVTPAFRTYEGDELVAFVVSLNLHRRHLDASQRAMVAARLSQLPLGTNQHGGGSENLPTQAETAEMLNVSDRSIRSAKKVQDFGVPELAEGVESGRVAVSTAATIAAAPEDEQREVIAADDEKEIVKRAKEIQQRKREDRQRQRSKPAPEPVPKPSPVMLNLKTHNGEDIQYPKPQSKPTFNETKGAGISWAAWSWNPVTGCLHGCDYCYAREIATDERTQSAYPAGFTPLFHHERLDAPSNTAIPARHRDDAHQPCGRGDCQICAYRRVFVCSMADLYGRWVPDEWINDVHQSMLKEPAWAYLLLTKFPDRYVGLDLPRNAWVGTSVDEQKRVRIAERAFRQIDNVKVKWLSLEPLKEPLEFEDLSMFDWVVIGAQTETRQPDGIVPAQDPDPEWVLRIALKAKESGCKVHYKPNLRKSAWLDEYPEG